MGDELKSAYELAMEKLRASGDDELVPLTDDQKARIAKVRSEARAKLAELEIMRRSEMEALLAKQDLEAVARLEAEHDSARRRIDEDERSRVDAIRDEPAQG
ncbi:MAG: hypothetical protein OEQ13_06085 [Acidobacteriota bacterium]|nr:hypothetical protein [Acidobacteriota bacterium]